MWRETLIQEVRNSKTAAEIAAEIAEIYSDDLKGFYFLPVFLLSQF